jgi:NAD(P)-dependent dehydrogenase (short-subunit alcohol dehydrogenase family)
VSKTFVITGASDGIGAAAARKAAALGHRVIVVGRNPEKTAAVAAEIGEAYYAVDFSDLGAVVALAEELTETLDHIDVLANNAGGVFTPRQVSGDGIEKNLQVNHLAGFLLTHKLLPILTASKARVIQTSSMAAARGTMRFDDLQFDEGYGEMRAYAQSKLANVLFTQELQRRYGDTGLVATSFHPGVIGSNFGSDGSRVIRFFYQSGLAQRVLPGSELGADRLLWLALEPETAGWVRGAFHTKNAVSMLPPDRVGDAAAERLWVESARILKQWL